MTFSKGVALVVGAASGIGRQVAVSFVREGCNRIAILDRDLRGLAQTEMQCSLVYEEANILAEEVDVQNAEDVEEAVRNVAKEFGQIDYAVNCAGVFGPLAPSHELSPKDFDDVTATNYRGTWLCSRAELTQMMHQEPLPTHDGRPGNRGAIVNVGSNLSLVSRQETPAYNASKAAILSMTRSDAIDYSKHNIRVNCVCPGLIRTPMTKDVRDDDPVVQLAPMKRMGTPQEVADAVLFLCSSKATFIQGATLSVDGGYVIN